MRFTEFCVSSSRIAIQKSKQRATACFSRSFAFAKISALTSGGVGGRLRFVSLMPGGLPRGFRDSIDLPFSGGFIVWALVSRSTERPS
jgi:hypothetical protein